MIGERPHLTAPSFEQHPTGFGVGVPSPRLSWRYISSPATTTSWEQTAYDVEIFHYSGSARELYHVSGEDSVLVPWPSKPLQSRQRARVRVRAYGNKAKGDDESEGEVHRDPEPTAWSPWAEVECALLAREDWLARPITIADVGDGSTEAPAGVGVVGPQRPLRFRKSFNIPFGGNMTPVARARLYITSLGSYNAYVNGQKVGDECLAPGWTSYNHRINYQVFDIAEMISTTRQNIIGVEVGEGWYATRLGFYGGKRCIWGRDLAVLAQLEVVSQTGDMFQLVSDDSWKCRHSAIIRSEVYDGELYDACEEEDAPTGWTGATPMDDSSWLATRMLPLPSARLVIPNAPPIRVIETIAPVNIFITPLGKTIIDFGQNLVGKLRVHTLHKPAGTRVKFIHAEVLEHGELAVGPLRDAKCTDEIITPEAPLQDWSPQYTYHGFRYVQVEGWSTTDDFPLTMSGVSALVMHTDMVRTGYFSCSHPMVNQLHENAVWSMRGNFLSVPTDCPQRDERLGWTGDIQIFCPSASFLYNTHGILGDWLQDLALEQLSQEHSIPPLVVPNAIEGLWAGDPQAVWDDVTVLTPWDLYQYFGDMEILRRQYPSMVAWVDKGIRRGPDGLWDIEHWQLGDWLDPAAPLDQPGSSRTNATLVADAYLVHVTSIISEASQLLGEQSNAARYSADHLRLKATFQAKYIAPSGLIIGDSQTALSLALLFSLHETETQKATAAARLAYLVRLAAFRVSTGFVGTPIITHALSSTGYAQLAYRMLLDKGCPSWLYPITMGATTIWERWDSMKPDGSVNGCGMTSFNHYALGSVINWLHSTVGGIRPLEPGWRKIRVQPIPGGTITSAKASFETPYGLVDCAWEVQRSLGTFTLDLVVPPSTKALVVLPGGSNGEQWVGSGHHSFCIPYGPEPWPPSPIRDFLGQPSDEFIA
ncbi:bacterial alpha-L-rhamnosidase-domain-containing protein [Aspergillus pseudoustus]|uniref:alpha-L-rhamnosidase n=1 Tax=Aspergillus pseudoustus TaxID=1810923 RepID=A0ABR4J0Q9_9EURO